MTDMPQVLRLVAVSGFVMKDYEILNEGSKVETVSKQMYYEINKKPFVLNKRMLMQIKHYKDLWKKYMDAFDRIREIAVTSPITGEVAFVRP